jgi:HSP20 family protein
MAEETSRNSKALAHRPSTTISDFDRAFDALWNRARAALGPFPFEGTAFAPWTPDGNLFRTAPTDVVDTGTAYQIKAEVPGIAKDQIDIRVTGNVVEISAENKTEKNERSPGYLHRERLVTGFHRAFELPEPVVAEKAKAQVVNGVLELELPKQQPTPQPAETKVKVE